tara:strand:- start:951 stop:1220 length:270 start_codon:yes stop_codon:yes gene_type:complete
MMKMIDEQLRTIQSTVWLARFIVENTDHLKGTEADEIIKEAKKIMLKDMQERLQALYDDGARLEFDNPHVSHNICKAWKRVGDELNHLS